MRQPMGSTAGLNPLAARQQGVAKPELMTYTHNMDTEQNIGFRSNQREPRSVRVTARRAERIESASKLYMNAHSAPSAARCKTQCTPNKSEIEIGWNNWTTFEAHTVRVTL
eukprot:1408051-Amphidinium_carterae.1